MCVCVCAHYYVSLLATHYSVLTKWIAAQELSTANAANERLSLILSAINEKLKCQLEALITKGLDTPERRQEANVAD